MRIFTPSNNQIKKEAKSNSDAKVDVLCELGEKKKAHAQVKRMRELIGEERNGQKSVEW